jgi:hypothetical protein
MTIYGLLTSLHGAIRLSRESQSKNPGLWRDLQMPPGRISDAAVLRQSSGLPPRIGSARVNDDERVLGVHPLTRCRSHRKPVNAGHHRPNDDRDFTASGLGNGHRPSRMRATSMGPARSAQADNPKTDRSRAADPVANRHPISPPNNMRRVNGGSAGARDRTALGRRCEQESQQRAGHRKHADDPHPANEASQVRNSLPNQDDATSNISEIAIVADGAMAGFLSDRTLLEETKRRVSRASSECPRQDSNLRPAA